MRVVPLALIALALAGCAPTFSSAPEVPMPPPALMEQHPRSPDLERMTRADGVEAHATTCDRIPGRADLDRYDCLIRAAVMHECAELEPDEVKRQMWQESSGRERVVSSAGAVGLMQLIPSTFRSMRPRGNIHDPQDNIRAGVQYRCWGARFWRADLRTKAERYGPLSLLVYNAGPGGGLDAQGECGGYTWEEFGPCAPAETRHYVAVIYRPGE